MGGLASLAMSAGSAVMGELGKEIGYGIGNVTGYNDRIAADQIEQQQKLTNMQSEANLGLMKESYKQQKELWDSTQAEAQVEHLKKAGLNPALIYAKGGAGGSTSGGGGASVGGASASDETSRQTANLQSVGMGLQLQKLASEINLNQSIAEKNKADAAITAGAETNLKTAQTNLAEASISKISSEIDNLKADTNLKGEQENLNRLQQNATEIANSYNSENNKTLLKQNISILESLMAKANVDTQTQDSLIKQAVENVKLTISQTLENYQDIKQSKQNILASINEQVLNRISTMAYKTRSEYETELQSSMQTLERDLRTKQIEQSEINTILGILGTITGASIFKGIFDNKPERKPKIGY